VTALVRTSRVDPARGLWSISALLLAALGVVLATWLVVATDSDPAAVLWPIVVAPVAIALAPVLAPRRSVRIAAVAAMGVWCVVTGFTIGFLLLPSLGVLVGAAIREDG
jgi:hypothetical protein